MKPLFDEDRFSFEIQKAFKKSKPPAGEMLQGAFFALYTAQERMRAASLLYSSKHHCEGFSMYVIALEEFSKTFTYLNLLIDWANHQKVTDFRNKQKDHIWKLQRLSDVFACIFFPERRAAYGIVLPESFSFKANGDFDDFVERLAKLSVHKVHLARLQTLYSNFDGKVVSSPHHYASLAKMDSIIKDLEILQSLLDGFLQFMEKYVGVLLDPIKNCFYETDPKKIVKLKKELNRRFERILPAIRSIIDDYSLVHSGKSIYSVGFNFGELFKDLNPTPSNMMKFLTHLEDLIRSGRKIDTKHFFPPLNDSAKKTFTDWYQSNKSRSKKTRNV